MAWYGTKMIYKMLKQIITQTIVIASMIASDFPYSSWLSDLSGPLLIGFPPVTSSPTRLPTSCRHGAKGIQRAPYSWASHPQYSQWPGLTLVKPMRPILWSFPNFSWLNHKFTLLWSLETNFWIYAHLRMSIIWIYEYECIYTYVYIYISYICI